MKKLTITMLAMAVFFVGANVASAEDYIRVQKVTVHADMGQTFTGWLEIQKKRPQVRSETIVLSARVNVPYANGRGHDVGLNFVMVKNTKQVKYHFVGKKKLKKNGRIYTAQRLSYAPWVIREYCEPTYAALE